MKLHIFENVHQANHKIDVEFFVRNIGLHHILRCNCGQFYRLKNRNRWKLIVQSEKCWPFYPDELLKLLKLPSKIIIAQFIKFRNNHWLFRFEKSSTFLWGKCFSNADSIILQLIKILDKLCGWKFRKLTHNIQKS